MHMRTDLCGNMGRIIYDMLYVVYGDSTSNLLGEAINGLFARLKEVINMTFVTDVSTIFIGVASALVVIFFMMEIISMASRDMLTSERFIIAMMKLVLAFGTLFNLPLLTTGLITFGGDIFTGVNQNVTEVFSTTDPDKADSIAFYMTGTDGRRYVVQRATTLEDGKVYRLGEAKSGYISKTISDRPGENETFYFYPNEWPEYITVRDLFEYEYEPGNGKNLVGAIMPAIGKIFSLFLPWILSIVTLVAGIFLTYSSALKLILRVFFAPIAVVQMFEDGTRSAGIQYIKKLFAELIVFSLMIVVIVASKSLTNSLLSSLTVTEGTGSGMKILELLRDVDRHEDFPFQFVIYRIVPSLAAVGTMTGLSRLSSDVVGV